MITVQAIRAHVAELQQQREKLSSETTPHFKEKTAFLQKEISLLSAAATEIERLQRQTTAQAHYLDNAAHLLAAAEKNASNSFKIACSYSRQLQGAGLTPRI